VKLSLAIVGDDDACRVADVLTEYGSYASRLSSTGGFLRMGNTALMSGIEDWIGC